MIASTEFLQKLAGDAVRVSGGLGGSREDPIVVEACSHAEAALAEYMIVRGIMHLGGYLWRELATADVDDGEVIQRKIERIEVTDTQIVTETANHYFARRGLPPIDAPGLQPIVYRDEETGIGFPISIAWLHYGETGNEAPEAPGGEILLRYSAPEMKSTVFVYPAEAGHAEALLDAQMTRAIDEVKKVHGDNAIKHDWGRQLTGRCIDFAFIPRFDDTRLSTIKIYLVGRTFVKVRTTFFDEQFMRKVWTQVDAALDELVGG